MEDYEIVPIPFVVDLLKIDTFVVNTTILAEEEHVAVGMPKLMDGTSKKTKDDNMQAPTISYGFSLPPQMNYLGYKRST